MATYQGLADILDETFRALSSFDCDKLQSLEPRIVLLAESEAGFGADEISGVLRRNGVSKSSFKTAKSILTRFRVYTLET
jgi:hypothetical protein